LDILFQWKKPGILSQNQFNSWVTFSYSYRCCTSKRMSWHYQFIKINLNCVSKSQSLTWELFLEEIINETFWFNFSS
jgi:hypothetical protein